ncbi:MAG TPA: hypothetical protein VNW72_12830 [Chthoniobacterales bacterium]|jgi:hypothetical protein|nr:hypothetical protein [Chthoniobacterales bacterium]
MKTAIVRLLFVLIFCTVAKFATADDFVSMVMQSGSTIGPINVPPDRFLVIRNFTQDGTATPRGSVSVTTSGSTVTNAFTATVVDPMAMSGTLEVVNNFVVGGPATVTVSCPSTTCFITYRKGTD